METILWFSLNSHEMGYRIISLQGNRFPDAIIRKGDKTLRVEFEYLSSNFIYHKHNPKECDLIICWRNNIKRSELYRIENLPIISIEEIISSENISNNFKHYFNKIFYFHSLLSDISIFLILPILSLVLFSYGSTSLVEESFFDFFKWSVGLLSVFLCAIRFYGK